jgi:hypothetical protein
MAWPPSATSLRLLLLVLIVGSSWGCQEAAPPEPPPDVVGRVLDTNALPFPQPVRVIPIWDEEANPAWYTHGHNGEQVLTDSLGRFALRNLEHVSYRLQFDVKSIKWGPMLRPLAKRGGLAQDGIKVAVSYGKTQDVGTWLAEDADTYGYRFAATFPLYCIKAFARQPVAVPEEAIPLLLEETNGIDYGSPWHPSKQLEQIQKKDPRLPVAKVAAICLREEGIQSGTYGHATGDPNGPIPAWDYRWEIVVILRDGKRLTKSFNEPAPKSVTYYLPTPGGSGGGLGDTSQEEKLRIQVAQWLREVLGETGQKP